MLVLRRENPASNTEFDFLDDLGSIAVALKQFSGRPVVNLVVRYCIVLGLGCDGGNDEAWLEVPPSFGKSLFAPDCVVADAVAVEPVSAS